MSLLASLAHVGFLFLVSMTITRLIVGEFSNSTFALIFGMVGTLLIRGVCEYGKEISAHKTAVQVKTELRDALFKKLHRLGPEYIERKNSGWLTATVVDGIEGLEVYTGMYIPHVFLCMTVPLAMFVIFWFFIDPVAACIELFFVPVILVVMMQSLQSKKENSQNVWNEFRSLSSYYVESVQGLPTLQLFNQADNRAEAIFIRAARLTAAWIQKIRISMSVHFLIDSCPYIGYTLALSYVAWQLVNGALPVSSLILVLLLGPLFYEHINRLNTYYHNSLQANRTIEAIFEILQEPERITYSLQPADTIVDTSIEPSFEFSDVSFAYDSYRPILKNCSFTVRPKETVALVGASGVGKSTVIDLLFRFHSAQDGRILLGEKLIENIPVEVARKQFSYVSQETYMFYGSILENLLIGDPEASEQQIRDACSSASLTDLISSLPEGLDTLIGERGSRLSGGEKQRVAIARAILKKAPVILLDEPTSSLDVYHESLIQKAIEDLLKEKTVLIIAHRLSTIRHADRILVMDEGRIIEDGTHDELMKLGGKYYQMVKRQEVILSSGINQTLPVEG
nr:ATP-binding cassette domain-containing protein [uncultured Methanospirillum sp.]